MSVVVARGKGDRNIIILFVLLAGMGLSGLLSASYGYALSLGKLPAYFALRQSILFIPGLLIFLFLARLDIEKLKKYIGRIVILTLVLLVLPLIPGIGESQNGANRWINLRISTIQPSEFWKISSIIFLAYVLSQKQDRIKENTALLIPPFLVVALGCFIIYLQNDFSTALIVATALLVVFWVAGTPLSFFGIMAAIGAPLVFLTILTSDFRLKRIITFLFPSYEPLGQSYQILGSLKAITSGGLIGKGFGLGTLKLGSIPEVQSDFILAAWTEETGFLGVLTILAVFAILAWRCFSTAMAEVDPFRYCLGIGITFLLCSQVLLNFAVVAGVLPATGVTLPFFSAGGSSLIATSIIGGLLYNLSRYRSETNFSGFAQILMSKIGRRGSNV